MAIPRLEQLRTVNWRKGWLWDIGFPGESVFRAAPFQGWVPAVGVVENLATLQAYDFTAGNSSFKVPQRTSLFTVQVTFVEDDKLTVSEWIRDWINNQVFLDSGAVEYVNDASKNMVVQKLDSRHNIIRESSYAVFPEGELNYEGDNDSTLPQVSVTFVVTKTIYQNKATGAGTGAIASTRLSEFLFGLNNGAVNKPRSSASS